MGKQTLKYRHEFNWALILTGATAIWLIIAHLSGMHAEKVGLYLSISGFWIVPAGLVIYWSIKNLRDDQNEGELSYWKGVQSGTLIAAISIPMHLVLYFAYFSTIGAGFFDASIQHSKELGMDQKELEMFFNLPALLFRETINLIASGFILSLIASMFLKNSVSPVPQTSNNSQTND